MMKGEMTRKMFLKLNRSTIDWSPGFSGKQKGDNSHNNRGKVIITLNPGGNSWREIPN